MNDQTTAATAADWRRITKKLRDLIEESIDAATTDTPEEIARLAEACQALVVTEANAARG